MRGGLLLCTAAACAAAAALVSAAPSYAGPPQCGDGAIVMAGCTGPGDCTAVIDNRCVGEVAPMLPPPAPVKVGIEGTVGVGG